MYNKTRTKTCYTYVLPLLYLGQNTSRTLVEHKYNILHRVFCYTNVIPLLYSSIWLQYANGFVWDMCHAGHAGLAFRVKAAAALSA